MKSISLVLLISWFAFSCKKDKLKPVNQEELITTVTITFIDSATATDTIVLSFQDIDGEGGMLPVISAGNFLSNTTYNASISVLDESQVPVFQVNEEIEEEGTEHQFFYQPVPGSLFSYFEYLDQDENGMPLGLSFRTRTGAPGSGNLLVVLRHEPDKYGLNVNTGDLTNAGGETDIEITFPVEIF